MADEKRFKDLSLQEKLSLIEAWLSGETLQLRYTHDSVWKNKKMPGGGSICFSGADYYRIKPFTPNAGTVYKVVLYNGEITLIKVCNDNEKHVSFGQNYPRENAAFIKKWIEEVVL